MSLRENGSMLCVRSWSEDGCASMGRVVDPDRCQRGSSFVAFLPVRPKGNLGLLSRSINVRMGGCLFNVSGGSDSEQHPLVDLVR